MKPIRPGAKGKEVEDVQRRLRTLGYSIDPEEFGESYGDSTAAAVSAFRNSEDLPKDVVVDEATWNALVNATFALGDRILFLRIPYFHGSDVREIQTALRVLGFPCGPIDGIFGAHTERAVREFQANVGLVSDGIVGDATFSAIQRLGNAWRDKDLLGDEYVKMGYSRAAEVLAENQVCIFGTDPEARSVASRISNLALATNPATRLVSAEYYSVEPGEDTTMLHITFTPLEQDATPQVAFVPGEDFLRRLRLCLQAAKNGPRRLAIILPAEYVEQGGLAARDAQHLAVELLDALCAALA